MRHAVVGLLCVALSASAAQAGVDFCNEFKHPIFVAVAYDDNGDWVANGWKKIATGECLTDPFTLSVKKFYYRAETDWIRNGSSKTQWTWGKGGGPFSVVNGSFTFHHADARRKGGRLVDFTGSIEGSEGPISETVTFQADGQHVTQKTN